MRLLNRSQPVSADEHERWFDAIRAATDCVYMAIEEVGTGNHVGNVWLAGIDQRHRKAELRIVIGVPNATGRGVGTEAINLMCRYAFDSIGLHRLYAYVLAFNGRAKRAFEKAGFTAEGILRDDRISDGRSVDVYVLGRIAGAV
jgi:RimJ/RimL family protein N-acetyltransferase